MILVVQRDQMAALVRPPLKSRTILASQAAFQFMDRRCLGTPNNVQRHGLMGVAAKAFDFEIAEPGIDRVSAGDGCAGP